MFYSFIAKEMFSLINIWAERFCNVHYQIAETKDYMNTSMSIKQIA